MPDSESARPANRLAGEASPYLRQHAHNPVDWYPWGPEALARAQELDRPIFLSVGYASCHWCHVMERESFEDEATAAELNERFVSIKVDREERPDVDAIYMDAVQAMTGSGGWPMTVFLTPDAKPFYGGTYFPDTPRHNMPSFRQVLEGVTQAWTERRAEVTENADKLAAAIAAGQAGPRESSLRITAQIQQAQVEATEKAKAEGKPAPVDPLTAAAMAGMPNAQAGANGAAGGGAGLVGPDGKPIGAAPVALIGPDGRPTSPEAQRAIAVAPLVAATAILAGQVDGKHGGWGGSPKFPQPMTLELLLRETIRTGDTRPLQMARLTLDGMARGGIYDHLGGGFARYSTDASWTVPHFEKMLYDNAQLARVYLHAWQLTNVPRYAEVVRETLDWAARELRVPENGAFASSLDADTEGEEGLTYVWTLEGVRAVLGDTSPLFEMAYGLTANGNFEGRSILVRAKDDAEIATTFGIGREEVALLLAEDRARLLAARDGRPQPARDDKVLAAWNGLMIAAYAEAGRFLPDGAPYTRIAQEAAGFILDELRTPDGRLLRSWMDGDARHLGTLEDHANLAEGLLALYETTFEERWFVAARDLMEVVLAHFTASDGGFHDTADDAETLIARPRSLQDNALPSGNAMAVTVLLRLHAWTGEGRYRTAAEQAVTPMSVVAARFPLGFAQWLIAYQLALAAQQEIAIVGRVGEPATDALLKIARIGFRPWQVVALGVPGPGGAAPQSAVPLLADRAQVDGKATAYVCRQQACQPPTT
ncbi:MAG: thioredoxin domain-containing protein, partial [Chloroflexota bacterium]